MIVRGSPEIRAFLWPSAAGALARGAEGLRDPVPQRGLGIDVSLAAAMVAGVAVFVALAAPVSGRLADLFGTRRVLQASLTVYGVGLLVPFLVDRLPVDRDGRLPGDVGVCGLRILASLAFLARVRH